MPIPAPRRKSGRRLRKVTFSPEQPELKIVSSQGQEVETFPTDFTQTDEPDAVEAAKSLAEIWRNEKIEFDTGARLRLASEWMFAANGDVDIVAADEFTPIYDQPCFKGHNDGPTCQAMSGHCRWSSWYLGGYGRCNLDIALIQRAFDQLKLQRKPRILVPVRTLIWITSEIDDELHVMAQKIIELFQQDLISYGDILACFYLIAPYILFKAERVNDIDTLTQVWRTFAQMKLPFAQKLDMADEFHKV